MLGADVQRDVGGRLLQRLQVGVDGDELDALDLGLDHAVDGVDAGAADADHAQHRRAGVRAAPRGVVGSRARAAVRRDVPARPSGPGARACSSGMSLREGVRAGARCGAGERVGSAWSSSRLGLEAARAGGGSGAGRLLRPAACSAGGAAAASSLGDSAVLVLGPAEQRRQRALAHARPLTACHCEDLLRELAVGLRPPCRPDRT